MDFLVNMEEEIKEGIARNMSKGEVFKELQSKFAATFNWTWEQMEDRDSKFFKEYYKRKFHEVYKLHCDHSTEITKATEILMSDLRKEYGIVDDTSTKKTSLKSLGRVSSYEYQTKTAFELEEEVDLNLSLGTKSHSSATNKAYTDEEIETVKDKIKNLLVLNKTKLQVMNDLKRKDTKLETNLFEIAWTSMENSGNDDDVKLFRQYYKRMFHAEDRKYRGLARWACQNFAAMRSTLMENVGIGASGSSSVSTAAVADTIQPEGGDIDLNLLPPRKRMKMDPVVDAKAFFDALEKFVASAPPEAANNV